VPTIRRKRAPSAGLPYRVLTDLEAVLAGDRAVYLSLGPEGAVLSVKGRQTFAFGTSIGPQWFRMSPGERAHLVVRWIEEAAVYCRKPRIRWAPSA